jgi:hypothetical protein
MTTMRFAPLLFLVAGCAATGAGDTETREARELGRELAGRRAGAAERCVPAQTGRAMQIVDSQTVVYREGRAIWVSRLDAPCPGLRPNNILVVEASGSQYCRGDLVRGLERHGGTVGPACRLRDFTPYRAAP